MSHPKRLQDNRREWCSNCGTRGQDLANISQDLQRSIYGWLDIIADGTYRLPPHVLADLVFACFLVPSFYVFNFSFVYTASHFVWSSRRMWPRLPISPILWTSSRGQVMSQSEFSYSPLGWDGSSKRNCLSTTPLRYLGLYWKNITIFTLSISTTVLFTILLDQHTKQITKNASYSTLPWFLIPPLLT